MMVANGRWCRSTVYGRFQRAHVGAVVAASVAAPPPAMALESNSGGEVVRGWGRLLSGGSLPGAFSADSAAVLVGCTAAPGRAFGRLDQSVVPPAAN